MDISLADLNLPSAIFYVLIFQSADKSVWSDEDDFAICNIKYIHRKISSINNSILYIFPRLLKFKFTGR